MQEKHLFEYAVVRVVPRVEREEFLNVGVILYCKDKKFLKLEYRVNKPLLTAMCADFDCTEVDDHLRSMDRICRGGKDAGPIAALDLASRFRWLTATRSTIVQSSKVHPGLCDDPADMLQKLFAQLVL